MASPRVMLADDHTILVEPFRKLLEPQYEVVGTVADGRALVESAPQLKPNVIVVDIAMLVVRQNSQPRPQNWALLGTGV